LTRHTIGQTKRINPGKCREVGSQISLLSLFFPLSLSLFSLSLSLSLSLGEEGDAEATLKTLLYKGQNGDDEEAKLLTRGLHN
jgi:hypothetical protein